MHTDVDDALPSTQPTCGRESVLGRFVGVLVSPGVTFARLASDSDWLRPLLVMAAVIGAYAAAVILRVPGPASSELVDLSVGGMVGLRVAALLVAIVIAMFGWFAWITALYVSFRAFGARTSLPHSLTLIGYAAAPNILKSATLTLVTLVTGSMLTPPTLGSVLHAPGAFAAVLGSVELFTVWNFVLLVIAVSRGFGFTRSRSVAVVLAPVLLSWLLQLSLGSLIA